MSTDPHVPLADDDTRFAIVQHLDGLREARLDDLAGKPAEQFELNDRFAALAVHLLQLPADDERLRFICAHVRWLARVQLDEDRALTREELQAEYLPGPRIDGLLIYVSAGDSSIGELINLWAGEVANELPAGRSTGDRQGGIHEGGAAHGGEPERRGGPSSERACPGRSAASRGSCRSRHGRRRSRRPGR